MGLLAPHTYWSHEGQRRGGWGRMVLEVVCRWGSPTKVLYPQPPGVAVRPKRAPRGTSLITYFQPCPRLRLASLPG
jgi:hypothetical protein